MRDRVVDLERVLNFRDFGGYEAAGGRRVKRKALYRSANFSEASDTDIERLDALGVHVVVDLRRPEERVREPNRWPGEGTRLISNDEGDITGLPPHLMALLQDNLTAATVDAYMRQIYREFPYEARHIDLYRSWFSVLADAEGAALIHCAAGKDRTGLGCALTLHVLGVPEEAIFADYELTNAVIDLNARLPRIQARIEERLGRPLDAEALMPMLGVNVEYLRGSLDRIEATSGSIDAYLESTLGVGPRERDALRAKFTD